MKKGRSQRNKTLELNQSETRRLKSRLVELSGRASLEEILDRTVHQDLFEVLPWLPKHSVDLIFADPPYNLSKHFNGWQFRERSLDEYTAWLRTWLPAMAEVLKPTGSIYICGDWRSAGAVQRAAEENFEIRNRITWEREKGRGALKNWKNSSEDIWYCTNSESHTFDAESVKLKKRVIAPYRDPATGSAKDWKDEADGRFRLTHPSNLWTDLTVPYWSMQENTDHPTQKPEKLLAKVILASSKEGDVVLDPFLGSGTTSVVAKKLGRHFIGVEIDESYCCLAERRLELAERDGEIQGYVGGVFWERNTVSEQKKHGKEIGGRLAFAEQ